nr:hypothetical protein CFP56_55999 [Quercus suber]
MSGKVHGDFEWLSSGTLVHHFPAQRIATEGRTRYVLARYPWRIKCKVTVMMGLVFSRNHFGMMEPVSFSSPINPQTFLDRRQSRLNTVAIFPEPGFVDYYGTVSLGTTGRVARPPVSPPHSPLASSSQTGFSSMTERWTAPSNSMYLFRSLDRAGRYSVTVHHHMIFHLSHATILLRKRAGEASEGGSRCMQNLVRFSAGRWRYGTPVSCTADAAPVGPGCAASHADDSDCWGAAQQTRQKQQKDFYATVGKPTRDTTVYMPHQPEHASTLRIGDRFG